MNEQQLTDTAMATLGYKAAQGGAATTILGWVVSSQGTAIIGICIGVVGLLVQAYFSRRRDKREQAEHERRMKAPL